MKVLATRRLMLRAWEQTDADFLFSLESLPETVRYLGSEARVMASLEEAQASIVRRRAVDAPGQGIWAIEIRGSGELAGNLLCKPVGTPGIDGAETIEIGWHLHPDAQGRGYAVEAAQAVIDYAHSRGITTLSAFVDPLNNASIKVCERLGMASQGLSEEVYGQSMLCFQHTKDLSSGKEIA